MSSDQIQWAHVSVLSQILATSEWCGGGGNISYGIPKSSTIKQFLKH